MDEEVFSRLGVSHIDEIRTDTPHGSGTSNIYPASVSFPGMNVVDMPMERVVGCRLKWKTRDEKEIIMLMGRDLLRYFLFVYNGVSSDVTLCY